MGSEPAGNEDVIVSPRLPTSPTEAGPTNNSPPPPADVTLSASLCSFARLTASCATLPTTLPLSVSSMDPTPTSRELREIVIWVP